MRRAIVLIDGEHYPPVVRAALKDLRSRYDAVGAVFVGGTEKIGTEAADDIYGVPLVRASDPARALERAIERFHPEVALDLSDEPVLSAPDRMRLASIALGMGVAYAGADFSFEPPDTSLAVRTPSLAIIGTGKRVGKTAVSAYIARYLKGSGRKVAVVAMGRGGPDEPELLRGDEIELTTADLLEFARQGRHAASDSYEDAVMSRVITVGCRRCGGGLAGEVFFSNVAEGAHLADSLGCDLVVFEGSGSAIPPVATNATLLVVGAAQGLPYVRDFFGPYRLHRADAVVIAGAEEPIATAREVAELADAVHEIRPDIPVVPVIFRPRPLADISGARVFLATTSPERLLPTLTGYLEREFGCEVVAASPWLSDRARLRADMDAFEGRFDLLLTELKAAAIDVVAEAGAQLGVPTVLFDNEPIARGDDLTATVEHLIARCTERRE